MIGRVEPTFYGSTRVDSRYYYFKDHLGSIRRTLNTAGNTVSAQDYYAYGEIIPGRSYINGALINKYKFTEKERDSETNLDYFGARYYDSELGRWLQVDPLADKYPGWSPYNYAVNNSIRLIDTDGKAVFDPLWSSEHGWISGIDAKALTLSTMYNALNGNTQQLGYDVRNASNPISQEYLRIKNWTSGYIYHESSYAPGTVEFGAKFSVDNRAHIPQNFFEFKVNTKFSTTDIQFIGDFKYLGQDISGNPIAQIIFSNQDNQAVINYTNSVSEINKLLAPSGRHIVLTNIKTMGLRNSKGEVTKTWKEYEYEIQNIPDSQ